MNRAAALALTPLSVVYGIAVRVRNSLYRRGVFKSAGIVPPVLSVGNLTTGGTGKTPLVEWLADQLAESGLRVCVLTRGYGRNSSGMVVVSDNDTVLSNVEATGDEP